jgi:hypothetical protein
MQRGIIASVCWKVNDEKKCKHKQRELVIATTAATAAAPASPPSSGHAGTAVRDDSVGTLPRAASSSSAGRWWACERASVGCEAPPVVGTAWNRRTRRRLGDFWRFSYCPRFHSQNRFGQIVEQMHAAWIRQVDTVRTQAVAQKVKFFRHSGGDRTYTSQSLHEPELP